MGYRDLLEDDSFVENTLGYHPANTVTAQRHAAMREAAKDFTRALVANAPGCPERTLAFRAVQEAMMWSNAAIAINGGDPVPDDPGRPHEMGKPGI
jgi:hypothetical protein